MPRDGGGSGDFFAVIEHPGGKKISIFSGDVKNHGLEASEDAGSGVVGPRMRER